MIEKKEQQTKNKINELKTNALFEQLDSLNNSYTKLAELISQLMDNLVNSSDPDPAQVRLVSQILNDTAIAINKNLANKVNMENKEADTEIKKIEAQIKMKQLSMMSSMNAEDFKDLAVNLNIF